MFRRRRFAVIAGSVLAAAAVVALLIYRASRPVVITSFSGAVLREDPDPHKQRPLENATIVATSVVASGKAVSDAAGYFRLRLLPGVIFGQTVRLTVRHPDHHTLELVAPATDDILVFRLVPKSPDLAAPSGSPQINISNVRVRYSLKSTITADVGSAVRTFDIENTGNIPCDGRPPCSPDGKWKAAVSSLSLDAGAGKQFRNVRVSCLAGPCPFTRIESDAFSRGGRVINVPVRNWSDRVTYVVEAEVVQTTGNELIRRSYPAIFGRSMNFTLPAAAQGPSIEAEVNGTEVVFPLGPDLILSWARCRLEVAQDRTKLYRCELKPDYRFP
jgi:hypothetical protein